VTGKSLSVFSLIGLLLLGQGAQADITSNLLAWYKLEGNVTDAQGSFNGTAVGSPTYAAGKVGQGIQLNGSTQWVNLGSTSLAQNRAKMTLAAWMFANDLSNGPQFISLSTNNGGTPTASSRANMTTAAGTVLSCGGKAPDTQGLQNVTSTATLSTGVWTHIVCVIEYDTNTVTIYINGSSQSKTGTTAFTNAATDNTTSASGSLGAEDDGSGAAFLNGLLDEVRIYSRALTSADVAELYAYGVSLKRLIQY
jgi:Concanavalin A-like lectin/glucanases superfamily